MLARMTTCNHCGEPCDEGEEVCMTCALLAMKGYGWLRDGVMHSTRGPDDNDNEALEELHRRKKVTP